MHGTQAETQDAMGEELTIFEMSPEEMTDFVTDLFLEFDADQNGSLDRKEFKAVMRTAKLGLSNKDIRGIMAEADDDGNGLIEYREFVPLMVDLLTALKAKEQAAQNRLDEEEATREEVEYHLLHGIPKEELEAVMRKVFEAADENGNGELSMEEFRQCLKSAELGMTRKEINLLLSECDTNQARATHHTVKAAVSPRPPFPRPRRHRTEGYAYAANVWALSVVQWRCIGGAPGCARGFLEPKRPLLNSNISCARQASWLRHAPRATRCWPLRSRLLIYPPYLAYD